MFAPPPPPPDGLALARLTLIRRPSRSRSCKPVMAALASSVLENVTNPKPRERPVSRSRITIDYVNLSHNESNGTVGKTAHIKNLTMFSKSLQEEHDAIRYYIQTTMRRALRAHYTDFAQCIIRRVPAQITDDRLKLLVSLPHGQWTGEAQGLTNTNAQTDPTYTLADMTICFYKTGTYTRVLKENPRPKLRTKRQWWLEERRIWKDGAFI